MCYGAIIITTNHRSYGGLSSGKSSFLRESFTGLFHELSLDSNQTKNFTMFPLSDTGRFLHADCFSDPYRYAPILSAAEPSARWAVFLEHAYEHLVPSAWFSKITVAFFIGRASNTWRDGEKPFSRPNKDFSYVFDDLLSGHDVDPFDPQKDAAASLISTATEELHIDQTSLLQSWRKEGRFLTLVCLSQHPESIAHFEDFRTHAQQQQKAFGCVMVP